MAASDPIVVGVDGSTGSRAALRVAAEQARAHRRPLRAVMVHGYLDQHHPGGATTFNPKYDDATAKAALDEILLKELGPKPDVEVQQGGTFTCTASAPIRCITTTWATRSTCCCSIRMARAKYAPSAPTWLLAYAHNY